MHTRDIDAIISGVQERAPDVDWCQLRVLHPADDDGIWSFSIQESEYYISLENTFGNCPFLVEIDEPGVDLRRNAETIPEAIEMVTSYLQYLRDLRDAR